MTSPEEGERDEVQASIAASLRSMAESLARIAAALSQPRAPFRGQEGRRFQPRPERGEQERGYGFPRAGRPGGARRGRSGPGRRWERGPRPEGEHR